MNAVTRVTCLLAAVLLLGTACDAGPPLPQVDRFNVRRLAARQTAKPWPVTLQGRHLRTSTRHPLRFEFRRIEPKLPRVRVALQRLKIRAGRVTGELPAGTPPGHYALVVYRGQRGRRTRHRVQIWAPKGNVGYPVLWSVRAVRGRAGEGGRVVITGANLLSPALVTLHGPQRRSQRDIAKGGARMVGRKVQMHFKPLYRRMRITELSHPRQAGPNRVVATLPQSLAPGQYYVQVYTASHRGNKPDVTIWVGARLKEGQRIWGAAGVGVLFTLGLLMLFLWGRPLRPRVGSLAVLFVVLMACAAPLLWLI